MYTNIYINIIGLAELLASEWVFEMYATSLSSNIKHLIFYSDNCIGQNRNQYVMAALLDTIQRHNNLEFIEQKFLQSGHTQMECDSMHSTKASKEKYFN